ncbi:hypothetical protein ACT5YT_06755 [Leuconostoc suionicum]|uniref:hypothetical protein n=1 Tax=Leuconostoc suionicum TaxID=1511761 RepID=UPI00403572F2
MKVRQLTLLDEQILHELQQTKYVVILVKELKDNLVQPTKKRAFVCLKPHEMKVKGELFDDCLGNHYIGCTVLKGIHYSDSGTQIPVFKLPNNIQDYLTKQLTPIISLLDQKRRNYYAN